MISLSQPLAHLEAYFTIDGKEYKVDKFSISFLQDNDFKGQPENEVRGGRITLSLSQIADANLADWGRRSTLQKSGQVEFRTDLGKRVIAIDFMNAYCINFTRELNALTGTKTTLIISPESVTVDEIPHTNYWKKAKQE